MGTGDNTFEDSIARALLGESTYERLRVERHSYFTQPAPTKIWWLSGLLFALALTGPIAATYPASVAELFGSRTPVLTSPKVVTLGVFAAAIEVGCATTLTAVELRRRRLEPDVSVSQAETMLTLEDLATLVGLVTGGATVLLTDAFFLLGYGGVAAVEGFVAAGGKNPFAPSGHGLSVAVLAAGALLAAVGFGLGAAVLDRRY